MGGSTWGLRAATGFSLGVCVCLRKWYACVWCVCERVLDSLHRYCQDTLDLLITEGSMEEVFVVGVYNTPDRINEYTYSYDPTEGEGGTWKQ